LAESLPNIKGLQQLYFTAAYQGFQSTTLPLLLEGFRKITSLVEVTIGSFDAPVEFLQEMKFFGQRNRITPLLTDTSPAIWSRALAKVATNPAVLFHVLRAKPNLVGSADRGNK
jgi:hypothetical protein